MPCERDCVDHLVRVSRNPHLSIQETTALGLLVARKWDRAGMALPPGAEPTAEDAIRHDNFTQNELDEFRASATRMLAAHATLSARPSWWYGVSQGLAAAFLYSLFLAVAIFIVKLSGSDVITLFRTIFGPN